MKVKVYTTASWHTFIYDCCTDVLQCHDTYIFLLSREHGIYQIVIAQHVKITVHSVKNVVE